LTWFVLYVCRALCHKNNLFPIFSNSNIQSKTSIVFMNLTITSHGRSFDNYLARSFIWQLPRTVVHLTITSHGRSFDNYLARSFIWHYLFKVFQQPSSNLELNKVISFQSKKTISIHTSQIVTIIPRFSRFSIWLTFRKQVYIWNCRYYWTLYVILY
jgi:hypothetical protein